MINLIKELITPSLLALFAIGSLVVGIYSNSWPEAVWWFLVGLMMLCWLRCSVDKFLHDDLCFTLIVEGD